MFSTLKRVIGGNLVNIPGWRTKRKIVVIESDDWGAIRMPSKEVYEKCLKRGIRVDKCHYCKYDTLASEDDLSALFDVLVKFRDKNGNHPIITADSVVANPDFGKIRQADFKEYHFENFTETLKRYKGCEHSFDLWKQGMNLGFFRPQFHGREHLNVARWLYYLQNGSEETLFAFDNEFFGLSTNVVQEQRSSFMAALDADNLQEIEAQRGIIEEGLDIFEKLFGFRSVSFIAPNYTWSPLIEDILADNGVKYLQGSVSQRTSKYDVSKGIKHFMGEKNEYNQIYTIRNCTFEPSGLRNRQNAVKECLRQIEAAFLWHKPAIISSHRLNYIGGLVEENRSENLILLKKLLGAITAKWGDVEFMSSDSLGELI